MTVAPLLKAVDRDSKIEIWDTDSPVDNSIYTGVLRYMPRAIRKRVMDKHIRSIAAVNNCLYIVADITAKEKADAEKIL